MDGASGGSPAGGEEADGDDDGEPAGHIEDALIEAHHLANLTGLDEAKLARKHLVNAQSATATARRRDLLRAASEYLELARVERRDTAAGFAEAQRLALRAEEALGEEAPPPKRPVGELLAEEPEPRRPRRRSLVELREEAAVNSFEQLRYDVLLDDLFESVRRGESTAREAPGGDLSPREALALAIRDIEEAADG